MVEIVAIEKKFNNCTKKLILKAPSVHRLPTPAPILSRGKVMCRLQQSLKSVPRISSLEVQMQCILVLVSKLNFTFAYIFFL